MEVAESEIVRACDSAVVLPEPGMERQSLFFGSGRVQRVRVSLAYVDWVFLA